MTVPSAAPVPIPEPVDPIGDFFREISHRIDLYPTVAPVGQAWPTLATYDLHNAWLRYNQQIRELRIREEQVKNLQAEIKRLRTWIDDECPACGGLIAYDADREPRS